MAITESPYAEDAIERLRQRTASTRAATASVTPGSGGPATAVNDTTVRPRSIIGRARAAANRPVRLGDITKLGSKAAKLAGKAYAPLSTIAAVADSAADDSTDRYAKRFGMEAPVGDYSMGDMGKFALLRALGFASDLGNNLTFGAAGNLFRDKDMPSQPSSASPIRTADAATVEPDTRPPQSTAPGERAPAADGQVDLGAMLDNPEFVPPRGTGIIRNQRTRRTWAMADSPDQAQPANQSTEPPDEQATNQPVTMPNLGLALDADTLPEYLSQFSAATQQAANNRVTTANKKGIIARAKGKQDVERGSIEIKQLEQLDQVLSELQTLDDSNDPDGSRRATLSELALTLQGTKPGDRFEFKTTKDVAADGFTPVQKIVKVNPRTGKAELVDPGASQPASANTLPPMEQRKIGETYETPRGPAVWRGNGWELVNGR